jgi:hypothetical protein
MRQQNFRPKISLHGFFLAWIVCILFLTGSRLAWSTNYYVSPKGSDSNNGLSQELPWKSIAKVNTFHFRPGDSILFQSGGTWRETLYPIYSGMKGHPITYGSYGSGDRPIIEGTDVASDWIIYSGNIWYKKTYSYKVNIVLFNQTPGHEQTSLSNLNNDQDWYWDNTAQKVYIYSSDDPDTRYNHPGIEIGASRQNGVKIFDPTKKSKYFNFNNLSFRHANDIGIELQGCNYINIDNCVVDTCGRINMFVYAINNLTINKTTSFGCLQQHGLYICSGNYINSQGDYSNNIIINHSSFYQNKQNGIQINPNNGPAITNLTLTKSELYENNGHGILDEGTYRGEYSYNLFYDNAQTQVFCHYNYFYHSTGDVAARNIKIFNNVIGSINTQSQYGLYISDYSSNCVVKNNILYWGKGIYEVVRIDQKAPDITMDYNCYYIPDPINKFKWSDNWYSSLSAWQGASQRDLHSLGGNPQFSNVGLYEFTLLFTSPCIDAGVNVGLTQDHNGNPVPFGSTPDIGSFEYSSK